MSDDFQYRNSDLVVFNDKVISLAVRRNDDKSTSLVFRSNRHLSDNVLYTSTERIIEDFQVIGENSNIRIVWRERKNRLFAESEFHYAEITGEGFLTEHRVLQCKDRNCKHAALLRAKMSTTGYLVFAVISEVTKKVILAAYDLNSYSQVASTLTLNDAVNERYLTSQKIDKANVVLLSINDNTMYLQFLLTSGTLRNYSVTVNEISGEVQASKLFDFALDNIGYHNSLIDSEKKLILITYSTAEKENNSIYAAKQKLFSSHPLRAGEYMKVSQTSGDYFRPFVIKQDDGYLIAWEDGSIHYTVIDSDLDIIEAETTQDAVSPGRILLTKGNGIFSSCQTGNSSNRDFGSSFLLTKLG